MKKAKQNPLLAAPGLRRTHLFLFKAALDIILERGEQYVREELKLPGLREAWILLTCYETRLTQSEVAQVNGINPNVMVRQADALERRGYLKRVRNAKNRREYFLELTSKGKAVVHAWDRSWGKRPAAFETVLSPLTAETADDVRDLAIRVIDCEYSATDRS